MAVATEAAAVAEATEVVVAATETRPGGETLGGKLPTATFLR